MLTVNIHQAKTHFSKLIDAAMHGKEVVIARSGEPILRLVPILSEKPKITFGLLKGKIRIAKDFDAPLPADILAGFEGK